MKPITKLNLNMNPAVCENGSLLYAKNMKVDKDGCLISDYGYNDIFDLSSYNIIGHIVGIDNKIYFFTDNEESIVYYSKYEFVHPITINPDYIYHQLYASQETIHIIDNDLPLNPGETKYYYLSTLGLFGTNIPYYGRLSELSNGNITDKDDYFGFTLEYNATYTKKDYLILFFNKIKYICENLALSNTAGGSTYTPRLLYDNNYAAKLLHNSNSNTSNIHELYFDINNDTTYNDIINRITIYNAASDKLLVTYLAEYVNGDEIGSVQLVEKRKLVSTILEYDELTKSVHPIKCSWKYSGGNIDGCVTTNITGEKILTIAEYNSDNNVDIPIKHINLSYCDYTDDESIYTQAPKVPIANLTLTDTYAQTIPNGVYIFFIRYEIRKDVYTKWYICSRPIFAGVSEKTETLQGGLRYINIHKDSAKSFIFNLSYVNENAISLYKKFQLGFIISHDDSVNARIWKSFDINTNLIYFDYADISEIDIYEFQKATYELYNVHNITNFKNRLYISNYEESNFNAEELKDYANSINVQVITKSNVLSNNAIKINGNIIQKGDNQLYYIGEQSLSSILNERMIYWDIPYLTDTNNTTTLDDAVVIDLRLVGKAVAGVVAIESNLSGDYIFGNKQYKTGDINLDDIGLRVLGVLDENTPYKSAVLGIHENKHEWYDKGLTFAYSRDSANNIIKLNNKTINKNPLYTYTGFSTNEPHWEVFQPDNSLTESECNRIVTLAKTEIENQSRAVYAYIKIKDGQNDYYIDYTPLVNTSNYIINSDTFVENIPLHRESRRGETNDSGTWRSTIMKAIKNKIVGINDNLEIILNINGNNVIASDISVGYKVYEFTIKSEENINDSVWHKRLHVTLDTNIHEFEWNIGFYDGVISLENPNTDIHTQSSTLMPFSEYAIYAHFVDEHNIISNGVHIKDVTTSGITGNFDTFELQYEIDALGVRSLTKYKAFFLSLKNIGNKIIEGFDFTFEPSDENSNEGWCYMSFIELDVLLYNANDNITIIDNNGNIITQTAAYYSSGAINPILAFGNCGFVRWHVDDITEYNNNNKFYIKIINNELSNEYNNLIKVTPYIEYTLDYGVFPTIGPGGTIIQNHNWRDIIDGFYGAYLCDVKKPNLNMSGDYYVTGHDIYKVTRTNHIELQDFNSSISINDSLTHVIRSNFNLNYLTLTEDINDQIFIITDENNNKTKQIAKVLNSATLSSIYELKSMYKDFANIYFNSISEYNIIKFDNTIRVSNTLSDENFNNSVFYFNPTSYYNIPSNRGIIVKLFSVGNRIMVHTKAALYQFNVNSMLLSDDKDIKLKESDPFDTGLVNMIDSQYGYGGIDNKEAGCITFDSYFFYDNASKHIFGYAGQNQLVAIDNTIYSFIDACSPIYCRTLHDEKNDRILFEFICEEKLMNTIRDEDMAIYMGKSISQTSENNNVTYNTKSFCLSYNYKLKSFISFHDLTLNNTFATRYYSYSYNTNNSCCILFDRTNPIDLTNIETEIGTWNIYGIATNVSLIQFGTAKYNNNHSPFAVVFVMQPTQANLESLDSVTYEANIIKNAITYGSINQYTIIQNDVQDYAPPFYKNPVIRFYALTNLCISSEIDTTINDAVRPTMLNDYKGFKYNKGRWSGNCFRNILNSDNVYKYPNRPNRELISDDNSIVYGKFFALFFEFVQDVGIKFEDIIINSKKY